MTTRMRIADVIANPRVRALTQFTERHAGTLAAGAVAIIFFGHFARAMVMWHGVPDWHNWFDQGQYFKSARAFAAFDFSPQSHLYPPLYALMAAPFTYLIPNEPFVVINLVCVVAATAMLVDAFGAVIGSRTVAALFAVTFLLWHGVAFETFVVPWTSTPATFFIIAAVFLLMRTERSGQATPRSSFLFGLALGLIVPTRPLDAVVALTLVPFWMVGVWRGSATRRGAPRLSAVMLRLLCGGVGAVIGPAILLATNLAIHGHPLSPYMASSAGLFDWNALPQKFVSIFFDSSGLFAEPGQTLMARFPWLTFAIAAVAVGVAYGPLWLRAAAAVVTVQFGFYLVYVDLLPNGLYNYLNYHYFRWPLWLAFLMIPAAWAILRKRFGTMAWRPLGVLGVAAIVLACLQFALHESSAALERQDDSLAIDLPRGGRIDYVDVGGLTADWAHTYFTDPRLLLDGHPWQGGDKIRALQTPTGTRFLFLRPIDGGRLEIPAANWALGATPAVAFGSFGFRLGFPKWLGRQQEIVRRGLPLRLDDPMGKYLFARGFADLDGAGRAIDAEAATLLLRLDPHAAPYRVHLTLGAAAPTAIDFRLTDAADPALTVAAEAPERDIELVIPQAAISAWWPTPVFINVRQPPAAAGPGGRPKITAIRID